jgi:hypothetical protein
MPRMRLGERAMSTERERKLLEFMRNAPQDQFEVIIRKCAKRYIHRHNLGHITVLFLDPVPPWWFPHHHCPFKQYYGILMFSPPPANVAVSWDKAPHVSVLIVASAEPLSTRSKAVSHIVVRQVARHSSVPKINSH